MVIVHHWLSPLRGSTEASPMLGYGLWGMACLPYSVSPELVISDLVPLPFWHFSSSGKGPLEWFEQQRRV